MSTNVQLPRRDHLLTPLGYSNLNEINNLIYRNVCTNGKHIKICCWNIHGLSQEKLNDCILGGFLQRFDIILLSETWAEDNSDMKEENLKVQLLFIWLFKMACHYTFLSYFFDNLTTF